MQDDKELVSKVTQQLDQDVETLDPAVRARLGEARQRAIKQLASGSDSSRSGRRLPMWLHGLRQRPVLVWASGLTLASAAGLSLALWLSVYSPTAPHKLLDYATSQKAQAEDSTLGLLSSDESFDFYDELAFYQWLAEKDAKNAG